MIKLFEDFITESKNYPIYKGVHDLYEILTSGKIIYFGEWDSVIRKNMGIKYGISVTRNFSYAERYGDILELDTQKLSDKYKIVPFSENPDFYLWYSGDDSTNIKGKPPKDNTIKGNWINKAIHSKTGKQYWDYKTNKNADDFAIAEEIIIAKEISIKYIKKVYLKRYDKKIKNLLDNLHIPYEIMDYDDNLSKINLKNKKIKAYSQI